MALMQTVNILLMLLLTAMPAQQNAEFSQTQGTSLLIFGAVALICRNVMMFFLYRHFNRDLFARLAKIGQPDAVVDPLQERRAWEQATGSSKVCAFFEFLGIFTIVLFPMFIYGYFGLQLSFAQIVYLGMAAMAAGIANLILGYLALEQWFEPVIQATLPKQFETQLAGLKGLSLRVKLSIAAIGLVLLSLLLVVPTAYHQVQIISADVSRSPQLVTNAFLQIINAGMGAIVVGVFLSFRLAGFFSAPLDKIIDLFANVEKGDFSRRIDPSSSDEFGDLYINFNRMADRLQELTSSLEQRVANRTTALATSAEISRRISTILDQRQLVSEVVEQVKTAFDYYYVHIYLRDEISGDLVMVGGTGQPGRILLERAHKIPKGKGLVGRAAEINSAVLVSDVTQNPEWLPNALLPETQSEIAVPIAMGTLVLGVLDVQDNIIGRLGQEDVDLLQSIANQVAIAIRNARLYTEIQQRAEYEALIASIGQQIQRTTSVENALQVTARELGRALNSKDIRVILEAPALPKAIRESLKE
jgi:putative methionine-R-sulfoxide reductase with GAF domain